MYGERDFSAARRTVLFSAAAISVAAVLILAGYVAALAARAYLICVLLALALVILLLASGELCLLPKLRYLRFLKEMQAGLRRQIHCRIQEMDGQIQLQDGVRVHALQVLLPDGDSRIFYLNASKTEFLPALQSDCLLVSYGRHIVEFSQD